MEFITVRRFAMTDQRASMPHHGSRAEASATRQRLFESAMECFRRQGYASTSMRSIADEAGVGLETAIRHFPTKSHVVVHLYRVAASDWESHAAEVDRRTLGRRFEFVVRAKWKLLEPDRRLFNEIFWDMTRDPSLGVRSAGNAAVRTQGIAVMSLAVRGSAETALAPDDALEQLTRFTYAIHLLLTGLWMRDPTPRQVLSKVALGAISALTMWLPLLVTSRPSAGLFGRLDRKLSRELKLTPQRTHDAAARQILSMIMEHRRLLPDVDEHCRNEPCSQCTALHLPKVRNFVESNEPIHIVLPAFPAKSPNLTKVVGTLPDVGEELALASLNRLCERIGEIYPPGARVTICSDGRVFNDLVDVADDDVTAYRLAIHRIIAEHELTHLDTFDLDDIFPSMTYDEARAHLDASYAEDLVDLQQRIKESPVQHALFNGIHRFLFEDTLAVHPDLSRNKARNVAKEKAYQVVRRSNAWGRLVAIEYENSIRLSIHPQPAHSPKIGVTFSPSTNVWLTPWHGVAVLDDDGFVLMKRSDAEELGASPKERDGRVTHFESRNEAT